MDDRDRLTDMTIPQLLRWRVQRSPAGVALREKEFGCWNNTTWARYYEQVRCATLGLEAIGLAPGDALAVISDNIPEMLVVAVGAQAAGGVSAGIYQSSLPGEIAAILDYMDVRYVFCDDQEQVDKLLEVRERIPKVRRVIYEDARGMRAYRADEWFLFLPELLEMGERAAAADPGRFDRLVDRGRADDVCHYCLTSGTTGLPKGAMMTHRNYINMGVQLSKVDPLAEGDEYVSFLPFAWIGEQMNSFGVALATGVTINFPESVDPTA
ncbi:MAG: AMP-binding protein [Desulfobacterales bacterium]|nr:AMP-binding protein [Desulfobacterales bacterium]